MSFSKISLSIFVGFVSFQGAMLPSLGMDTRLPTDPNRAYLKDLRKNQEIIKKLEKEFLETIGAQNVLKEIRIIVDEKLDRLSVPQAFREDIDKIKWIEAHELFDETQTQNFIAKVNTETSKPLKAAIQILETCITKWRLLSTYAEPLWNIIKRFQEACPKGCQGDLETAYQNFIPEWKKRFPTISPPSLFSTIRNEITTYLENPCGSFPTEKWEADLRPFLNTKFFLESLEDLKIHYEKFDQAYLGNFGNAANLMFPPASCFLFDKNHYNLPQSKAYPFFPSLHINGSFCFDILQESNYVVVPPFQVLQVSDQDYWIHKDYLYRLWGQFFNLPTSSFFPFRLENVLTHVPIERKSISSLGGQLRAENSLFIAYRREKYLHNYREDPNNWQTLSKTDVFIAQKYFPGPFLNDFLTTMAAGGPFSVEDLDGDCLHRQTLMGMLTGCASSLKDWGLLKQKNGKLAPVRIGFSSGPGDSVNIFYLLTLLSGHQHIPETIRQEFLNHDRDFLITHSAIELQSFNRNLSELYTIPTETQSLNQGFYLLSNFCDRFKKMHTALRDPNTKTYVDLFKVVDSPECHRYKATLDKVVRETEKQRERIFLKNVLLASLEQFHGTFFNGEALKGAVHQCLEASKDNPGQSIEEVIHKIEEKATRLLFLSIYEATKDRPFLQGRQILEIWKSLTNPQKREENKGADKDIVQPLFNSIKVSEKPIDQQVSLWSLFLEIKSFPLISHPDWNDFCAKILSSDDPAFLRKFIAISPTLRNLLESFIKQTLRANSRSHTPSPSISPQTSSPLLVRGSRPTSLSEVSSTLSRSVEEDLQKSLFQKLWDQSSHFPLFTNILFKEELALYASQNYDAQIQRWERENTPYFQKFPKTAANNLFRFLWRSSDEPLLSEDEVLFDALLDLLLLPRSVGMNEEAPSNDDYASLGFVPGSSFPGAELSQFGPTIFQDGVYKILTWSKRCTRFWRSSTPIPPPIYQTILSNDIRLLCLTWLSCLQKKGFSLRFQPWFIETLLGKAIQMQETMATHPTLLFSEMLDSLWPEFVTFNQAFFIKDRGFENCCERIRKTTADFVQAQLPLDALSIDWDRLPFGHKENLKSILEERLQEYQKYQRLEPLSFSHAATQSVAHAFSKAYGINFMKIILGYAAKLQADYQQISVADTIIKPILEDLIDRQASARIIHFAASLYANATGHSTLLFSKLLKKLTIPDAMELAINWYLDYCRGRPSNILLNLITSPFNSEVHQLVAAVYLDCPLKSVMIAEDSLKVSGTHCIEERLGSIIGCFPHITCLDISENNLSSLSGNLLETLKRLQFLKKLVVSRNPLYDPSPFKDLSHIKNIDISDTYIPGKAFFHHYVRYSDFPRSLQRIAEPTQQINHEGIGERLPSIYNLSLQDTHKIVSFYENAIQAISVSQSTNYYTNMMVEIINQLAQNFWPEALDLAYRDKEASESFFSSFSFGQKRTFSQNILGFFKKNPQSVNLTKEAQKLIFAVRFGLPRGALRNQLRFWGTSIISVASYLKRLVVEDIPLTKTFLESLDQFSNLQRLSLKKVNLKTLDDLPCMASLKLLDLSDNQITNLGGLRQDQYMVKFPDLRKLTLKGNGMPTHDRLDLLLDLRKLRYLDISCNKLNRTSQFEGLKYQRHARFSLTYLDLRENFLDAKDLEGWAHIKEFHRLPQNCQW